MTERQAIVITTINYPTEGIKKLAKNSDRWNFIVVGDKKTPDDWQYDGVNFFSVSDQSKFDSLYAQKCRFNHYARKNIGYLKAIKDGAKLIYETDDDNIPYDDYLSSFDKQIEGQIVRQQGWENVYTHFTDVRIWPRGFPLQYINESLKTKSSLGNKSVFDCPIQQFLADGDPDVDSIYRLTTEAEVKFVSNSVVLSTGTFCPFNSQNTLWWSDVYPLLYLPSWVSFRMTDIWRSFVAQICLYQLDKYLAFRDATVFQVRNEHSLIKDFEDEISGYLNNVKIIDLLAQLSLSNLPEKIGENLYLCYEKLVENSIVPQKELHLVEMWLKDLDSFGSS